MSAADKTKLDGLGGGVFGGDAATVVDDAATTNATNNYNNGIKLTYTTPALTGTYMVHYTADLAVNSNTARYLFRLQNTTDAVTLGLNEETVGTSGVNQTRSGFAIVTLAGVAKTYQVQFASQNNSATVTCRNARMLFYRLV